MKNTAPNIPDKINFENIIPIEKPTENWTKFPNCILDNLDKVTPMECKILMLMVRKNYGYQQPNMKFSLTYICREIGHGKDAVIKAIDGLLKKQSIKVIETGKQGVRYFDINWVPPIETGRKIRPVVFSDRSGKPTDIGREIVPDTFIKENSKKNDNVKAQPKPEAMVKSKAKSSFVFSEKDLKQLIEALPEDRKSKQVEERLKKAFNDGKGVDYLLDCIAYAHDKATDNFLGYLGNIIDVYGVKEGYHQEAIEKKKRTEAAAAKKRERALSEQHKVQQESETKQSVKAEQGKLDALLETVDIDALDAFIAEQDLTPFNKSRFKMGKRNGLRWQYVKKFCETTPDPTIHMKSESMTLKQGQEQTEVTTSKPMSAKQGRFRYQEKNLLSVIDETFEESVKEELPDEPILTKANDYLRSLSKKRKSKLEKIDVGVVLGSQSLEGEIFAH